MPGSPRYTKYKQSNIDAIKLKVIRYPYILRAVQISEKVKDKSVSHEDVKCYKALGFQELKCVWKYQIDAKAKLKIAVVCGLISLLL